MSEQINLSLDCEECAKPKHDGNCPPVLCSCGHDVSVRFNPVTAARMSVEEIRQRWPRVTCENCCCVHYASTAHFVYGDW